MKYSLLDDYSEGCHPSILEALNNSNFVQQTAYGLDEYTENAKTLIRAEINNDQADVYLVTGGTLANIIIMSSSLRPHEAIISAETGHIAMRETGAIEATGHKIITMPSTDGKLTVASVQAALDSHMHAPHMVKPKLVYLSNATEVGTIYSKSELEALYQFCQEKQLYLFVDGARLGTALCCDDSDMTMADIARYSDIFTIGGTKNGALIGEAIVINRDSLKEDFAFIIKQRGALLAKGRLLGVQFVELFREGLYFTLTTRANKLARDLSNGLVEKGHSLEAPTQTNQIFAVLPNDLIAQLQEHFDFYVWGKKDKHSSVVRLVTSWATPEEEVKRFIAQL